jgi:hypothetical protein
LALFRAAAAAGLLLVLAPEQTREALSAIFLGAQNVQKNLPSKDDAASAAMRLCTANAEACASMARGALDAGQRLKPSP